MFLSEKQYTNTVQKINTTPSSEYTKNQYHTAMPAMIQKKENNTGIPDNLKQNIEQRSGFSMDDVKVYYHSSKPAQLHALAYAQGTNVYIASGQEKHLAHELTHVIQQKQGIVKPTTTVNGVAVNDDPILEKQADTQYT